MLPLTFLTSNHLTLSPSYPLTFLPSHPLTLSPSYLLTFSPSHPLIFFPSHLLKIINAPLSLPKTPKPGSSFFHLHPEQSQTLQHHPENIPIPDLLLFSTDVS